MIWDCGQVAADEKMSEQEADYLFFYKEGWEKTIPPILQARYGKRGLKDVDWKEAWKELKELMPNSIGELFYDLEELE